MGPQLDPMMLMMLASGANPGGAANPLLDPNAGTAPISPMAPNMQLPSAGAPAAPEANPMQQLGQAGDTLGQVLGSVKAPTAAEPKFSGGVTGSGLPYLNRPEDMMSPFMQSINGAKTGSMPTLGQLLMQSGGK